MRLSEDVASLDDELHEQLVAYRLEQGLSPARPRRDAVLLRILDSLASEPVLTAASVVDRFEVSPPPRTGP